MTDNYEYASMTGETICKECGAVGGNRADHDRWHDWLEKEMRQG